MTLAKFGVLETLLAIFSVCCTFAGATTVRVRTIDPAGEKLSNALVIVRSIDGDQSEVLRALTGANGLAPEVNVPPGAYEAIATYPYGPWTTEVKDFMVQADPVTLELQLGVLPGQTVELDVIDWHVRVADARGRPVANAWVIGRTPDATEGVSVARTDSHGSATVTLHVDEAEVTVLYKGQSYSQHFYLESGATACAQDCYVRAAKKLRARSRTLTFTVP